MQIAKVKMQNVCFAKFLAKSEKEKFKIGQKNSFYILNYILIFDF